MSLEEQVNITKKAIEKEIDRYKSIVFGSLLDNNYTNAIPESLFKRYFLPCFLGQVDNSNWVLEWVSIAGSPMGEVAVFDDNTKEILFIVPSILNTNNLLLHSRNGNLSDIFTRYEQLSNNIPLQGVRFLLEALNSKNNELLNNYSLGDVNTRWISILKRYGLFKEPVSNLDNSKDDDLESLLDF